MELQAGFRFLAVLCVVAALLSACEGASESGERPQPLVDACYDGLCDFSATASGPDGGSAAANDEFVLHWSVPRTRTNGEQLSDSEIMAYALLVTNEQVFGDAQELIGRRVTSRAEFQQRAEQLSILLGPDDVEQLLVSGSDMLVLVYPPDVPFRLKGLPRGDFYVAVAAIDTHGQFSELSNTLKLSVR